MFLGWVYNLEMGGKPLLGQLPAGTKKLYIYVYILRGPQQKIKEDVSNVQRIAVRVQVSIGLLEGTVFRLPSTSEISAPFQDQAIKAEPCMEVRIRLACS